MQHRLRDAHKAVTRPTLFRVSASHAHHVSLHLRHATGGHPTTHAMHKGIDGSWHVTLELSRGRYIYHFVVDNVPTLDPTARGTVHDDHGGVHSMREVGH
ncbi:MAG TPA: glycogen-binding domain-containing protein [Verrucomicrobiae bacterium]|nr:glycogen-binding domain-containing protein [Verrucomicrobiae bacterium]